MIKRELGIFLIVGSMAVMVDYLTYRSLVWTQWLGIDVAKAVGFITGTVFAYFANRFWTFGHKSHAAGSVWRFALLYTVTLLANVGINALVLTGLAEIPAAVQIAFLIATGVSAAMNFIGLKWFAFKAAHLPESI